MQHIRQLQLALTVLLVALVLLVVCGAALIVLGTQEPKQIVKNPDDPNEPPTQQAVAAVDPAVQQGKTLFANNSCNTCHAITDEKLVGPGLKGISQRRPEAWIISWVKNSQKLINSGDQYAVDLFNQYNKIQMPTYDNLSDDDIKAIVKYVESGVQ